VPDIDPILTAQIQHAIKSLDRDGTGVVSYVDFLLALTEEKTVKGDNAPSPTSPRSRASSMDNHDEAVPSLSAKLPRPFATLNLSPRSPRFSSGKLEKCKEGDGSGYSHSQSAESKS
jgi:hypothetical protein